MVDQFCFLTMETPHKFTDHQPRIAHGVIRQCTVLYDLSHCCKLSVYK